MVQALKDSTTYASIRFKVLSAGSTSTQRVKSKSGTPSLVVASSNKTIRFQQLELKHVEDRGCFAAMEFR